jgi:hypothetical protein
MALLSLSRSVLYEQIRAGSISTASRMPTHRCCRMPWCGARSGQAQTPRPASPDGLSPCHSAASTRCGSSANARLCNAKLPARDGLTVTLCSRRRMAARWTRRTSAAGSAASPPPLAWTQPNGPHASCGTASCPALGRRRADRANRQACRAHRWVHRHRDGLLRRSRHPPRAPDRLLLAARATPRRLDIRRPAGALARWVDEYIRRRVEESNPMTGRARANGEGSIFPYRNGYAAYA